MVDSSKLAVPRLALIVWAALLSCVPFAIRPAAAAIILNVEASNGLPGFNRADLSRYLASHMAEAGLADWRFEVAENGPVSDWVEWSFKLNPYAGGEVRRSRPEARSFHLRRPITIEARLYLNGEYQVTVEKQAIIDEGSGRNDPHLAEAVASVTQNLLGPSGAYHAVELGQRPDLRAR
jgi:hypothetical protein